MKIYCRILLITWLVLIASACNKQPTKRHVVEAPLAITTQQQRIAVGNNLACTAYLHQPNNLQRAVPLLLLTYGTGLYTMSAQSFGSGLEGLLRDKKIAILAIDRPGIKSDPNSTSEDPNDRFEIDLEEFARYRQSDFIDCQIKALEWVRGLTAATISKQIIMRGHSEGAELSLKLLYALHQRQHPYKDDISHIVASGVPMLGLEEVIKMQKQTLYPKGVREQAYAYFQKMMREKDDFGLVIKDGGLSSTYLRAIYKEPVPQLIYQQLANYNPPTEIHFFQGTLDKNTPVDMVRDFEKWNNDRKLQNDKHLQLKVTYFEAYHGLNQEAGKAMIDLLRRVVAGK